MKRKLLLMTLAGMASLTACKKAVVDAETQTAEDNAIAESGYNRIMPAVSQFGIKEDGVNKTTGFSCAVISYSGDTAIFPAVPVTVIIDFGSGCIDDQDGRLRKGRILATFYDYWTNAGSTVDVSLDNYSEDGIAYDGDIRLTYNGNWSYTTNVQNGSVSGSSGWSTSFSGSKTITWQKGYDTPNDAMDDVFKVSGSSKGTSRKGRKYTTEIIKPLIRDMSCKWIQEGTFELTPDELATRTVDFGDGTCDGNIVVTINGNEFPIELQ